jgi:hypothetical protein
MRSLLLPVAALSVAAVVLFSGLGQSLANTEIPDRAAVETAPTAPVSMPDGTTTGAWVETDAKPPKPPKSAKHKPIEPFPPGSRRR